MSTAEWNNAWRPFVRRRGDYAGVRPRHLPPVFDHINTLSQRTESTGALAEDLRATEHAAYVTNKSHHSAKEALAGLKAQLADVKNDLILAADQLRVAQQLVRAYPPELKASANLIVTRFLKDIDLLEDHADYLRTEIAEYRDRVTYLSEEDVKLAAMAAKVRAMMTMIIIFIILNACGTHLYQDTIFGFFFLVSSLSTLFIWFTCRRGKITKSSMQGFSGYASESGGKSCPAMVCCGTTLFTKKLSNVDVFVLATARSILSLECVT